MWTDSDIGVYGTCAIGSLRLDSRELDDLCPLFGLFYNELFEPRGDHDGVWRVKAAQQVPAPAIPEYAPISNEARDGDATMNRGDAISAIRKFCVGRGIISHSGFSFVGNRQIRQATYVALGEL